MYCYYIIVYVFLCRVLLKLVTIFLQESLRSFMSSLTLKGSVCLKRRSKVCQHTSRCFEWPHLWCGKKKSAVTERDETWWLIQIGIKAHFTTAPQRPSWCCIYLYTQKVTEIVVWRLFLSVLIKNACSKLKCATEQSNKSEVWLL